MSLRGVFVGSLAALLTGTLTACSTFKPDKDEAKRIADQLPDYTVTNPETGCRYMKDPKNPDKPQPCLAHDLPQPHIK